MANTLKARKVLEVMSRNLLWVGPDATMQTVSQLMAQKDVGSILVKSGTQIVGIITEKDLVRKIMAKGLSPGSVTAEMVMSYPIASVDQETSLDEARRRMGEQNIRHLMVTHQDQPVGMISVRTVLDSLT
ncbi:MAG TPA: CBS domain-containing protein [Nitrospiria bacterium]|nr:CBS domain-containing protein [Nitrospiria bacterium]